MGFYEKMRMAMYPLSTLERKIFRSSLCDISRAVWIHYQTISRPSNSEIIQVKAEVTVTSRLTSLFCHYSVAHFAYKFYE